MNNNAGQGKKVFIVEDDRKIAMAMGVRVKSVGYDVEIAYDAITAVKAARAYKPDVILLDLSMPGGDGFSLAEKFNMLIDTAGTPIVFITASKKAGLRERAEEIGASGFIEKPYDPEKLIEQINALV